MLFTILVAVVICDIDTSSRAPLSFKIEFTFMFYVTLLGSAALEEAAFRYPITIAVDLESRVGTFPLVIVSAIALSILFGYLHGGILFIFIQGVSGLLYSVLFLKCGGYARKALKPVATCTAAHFAWNAGFFSTIYALGLVKA